MSFYTSLPEMEYSQRMKEITRRVGEHMKHYHYHYENRLCEANEYLKKRQKLGFIGVIHRIREDLYEIRTIPPEKHYIINPPLPSTEDDVYLGG